MLCYFIMNILIEYWHNSSEMIYSNYDKNNIENKYIENNNNINNENENNNYIENNNNMINNIKNNNFNGNENGNDNNGNGNNNNDDHVISSVIQKDKIDNLIVNNIPIVDQSKHQEKLSPNITEALLNHIQRKKHDKAAYYIDNRNAVASQVTEKRDANYMNSKGFVYV
eukprot:Pgem_evm1s18116